MKKSKVQSKYVPKRNIVRVQRTANLYDTLDDRSRKLLDRAMQIAVIQTPKSW